MFAAAYGRGEVVRELLEHGADPGIRTEVVDVLKRMVVDKAAQERLGEALAKRRSSSGEGADRPLAPSDVQAAIATQREFLDSPDVEELLEGFTPDDLARVEPAWTTPSGYQSDETIIRRPLMETLVGATGGMTALIHAAREGHIDAVKALIDGGAEIDQVSADGSTALVTAAVEWSIRSREDADRGVARIPASRPGPMACRLCSRSYKPIGRSGLPNTPSRVRMIIRETGYMELLSALLEAGATRTHG